MKSARGKAKGRKCKHSLPVWSLFGGFWGQGRRFGETWLLSRNSARGKAKGRSCSILCPFGRFLVGSGAKEGSSGKFGSLKSARGKAGWEVQAFSTRLVAFWRVVWGQGRRLGNSARGKGKG